MSDYPTDEQLRALEDFTGTPSQYAQAVKDMWWPDGNGADITRKTNDLGRDVYELRLATGGWSGNEEIISIVRESFFHLRFWEMSRRGGLWIYHVPVQKWADGSWSRLGSVVPAETGA